MRRFRFHLGTLVTLVLLLAVGLAALRESNEIWDSSIFSMTLGVLLISILLGERRLDRRRDACWIESDKVYEHLGRTVVNGIRHHRELHPDRSFIDRRRRRTLGRWALPIPPHEEATWKFCTGSSASLDLE